MNFTAAVTKGV